MRRIPATYLVNFVKPLLLPLVIPQRKPYLTLFSRFEQITGLLVPLYFSTLVGSERGKTVTTYRLTVVVTGYTSK